MSPEQATGDRAVDARTDIYSLGAVTYEMLTGDPPHTGSSSQAIIARVLTESYRAVRVVRPNVPPHVEAAVDHALERLSADRFGSAREFADAMSGKVIVGPSIATLAARSARSRPTSRERTLGVALAIAVVLLVGQRVFTARRSTEPPNASEVRFEIATPRSDGPLQVSISPDGSTIVFTAADAQGHSSLWARPLRSPNASPISGTTGINNFSFWSADSRFIGFLTDRKLKRTSITGGTAETICEATGNIRGASWSQSNVIVFSMNGELYRVPASGGVPAKLTLVVPGAGSWEGPWFLPDGVHFLVVARRGTVAARGVYVASLDGGTPIRVAGGDSRVAFAPPDQLLFVREEALYAQTLDTRRFRVTGEPVRIIDDVGVNPSNGVAGFSVSTTGVLVKRPSRMSGGEAQLRWYSRAGAAIADLGEPAIVSELALSPDDRHVALTRFDANMRALDVWVVDVVNNVTSRLTSRPEGVTGVTWSPDSRSVTYLTVSGGSDTLFARAVGASKDSVVFADSELTRAEDYSQDGRMLLLRQAAVGKLLVKTVGSTRAPVALGTLGYVDELRLSPDASVVSYGAREYGETGNWQIWAASFPSLENRRQVSAGGGMQARWRADGKELFFLSPEGKVMSATVTTGPAPTFGAPTVLFQSPVTNPDATEDQYDVTRDGQRFLFAVGPRQITELDSPPLTVVLNWTNALKRK
jgi:Tol biopolymer transport system component